MKTKITVSSDEVRELVAKELQRRGLKIDSKDLKVKYDYPGYHDEDPCGFDVYTETDLDDLKVEKPKERVQVPITWGIGPGNTDENMSFPRTAAELLKDGHTIYKRSGDMHSAFEIEIRMTRMPYREGES